MHRTVLAAALALLALVGTVTPAAATPASVEAGPPAVPESADTAPRPEATDDAPGSSSVQSASAQPSVATPSGGADADAGTDDPPDPEEDVLGWERGYWHNESIDVDQTDGLSAAERRAVIARTMARVERIRRLEFTERVPVSIITRQAYRERVGNGTYSASLRAFDNAKFEALLLVGESTDSIGIQERNIGSAVGGFYSIERDEIVLVAPNASAVRIEEYILAHELVHALQDQQFNLSRLFPGSGTATRDEISGLRGIGEGDAYYVDRIYENRCTDPEHPWNGTCVRRPGGIGGGDLANIGIYIAKRTYIYDGVPFVASLRARGGWAAVDAAYDNPPTSTEQVIHPERYPDDRPTEVDLADRTGGSWTRLEPAGRLNYDTLGQGAIATMLAYPLYDSNGRTQTVGVRTWLNYTDSGQVSSFDPVNFGYPAAAGWDGDRLHVYRNGDNETAYVWRIVWDTERDVSEFLDVYTEVLEYWGAEKVGRSTWVIEGGQFADAFHVDVDGRTVTIVNAPTVGELSGVRTDVTVGSSTPTATGTPMGTATPTVADDDGATGETSTAAGDGDGTASTPTPEGDGATATTTNGLDLAVALAALALAAVLLVRRRT